MGEQSEGPAEPINGVPKLPRGENSSFDQDAQRTEKAIKNRNLNPDLNSSSSFKKKLAGGLAALGIAFGGGVVASDKVQETVGDAAATTRDIANTGLDVVKAPYEVTKDAGGAVKEFLDPRSNPDKPRNPDQVMVGTVSIETSDKLNVRTSPNIPGKESPGNEIDWKDVKLVNQIVVDGQIQLVPVDFKPGDILIVNNPELVVGQKANGGNNAEKDPNWLMLYTVNDNNELRAVYVSNEQTFPLVKTTSQETKYIDAKTIQDSNDGLKAIQYEEPLPPAVNQISVLPSANQVTNQ